MKARNFLPSFIDNYKNLKGNDYANSQKAASQIDNLQGL